GAAPVQDGQLRAVPGEQPAEPLAARVEARDEQDGAGRQDAPAAHAAVTPSTSGADTPAVASMMTLRRASTWRSAPPSRRTTTCGSSAPRTAAMMAAPPPALGAAAM